MNSKLTVLSIISIVGFSSCTKKNAEEQKYLNVDQNFTFPAGFPPDPGEKGKATLEGIDSDKDGVRDDLQRWIYATYPNEPEKVRALRIQATHLQKAINYNFDKINDDELQAMQDLELTQFHCFTLALQHNGKPSELIDELASEYLFSKAYNTKERIKQEFRLEQWLGGKVIESKNINWSDCEK